jgi:hypothetical protein
VDKKIGVKSPYFETPLVRQKKVPGQKSHYIFITTGAIKPVIKE